MNALVDKGLVEREGSARKGYWKIKEEEALKKIEELKNENTALHEELEYYKNRKLSGRQKHNAKWVGIYNDFVAGYETRVVRIWSRLQSATMSASVPFTDTKRIMRK